MRLAGLHLGGTRCIAVLGERPTSAERREFPTSSSEQTLAAALGVLRK